MTSRKRPEVSLLAALLVGCSTQSGGATGGARPDAGQSSEPGFTRVIPPDVACSRLHDAGCELGDDPHCVSRLEFADARRQPGLPSVFEVMAQHQVRVETGPSSALLTFGEGGIIRCRGTR